MIFSDGGSAMERNAGRGKNRVGIIQYLATTIAAAGKTYWRSRAIVMEDIIPITYGKTTGIESPFIHDVNHLVLAPNHNGARKRDAFGNAEHLSPGEGIVSCLIALDDHGAGSTVLHWVHLLELEDPIYPCHSYQPHHDKVQNISRSDPSAGFRGDSGALASIHFCNDVKCFRRSCKVHSTQTEAKRITQKFIQG